MLEFNDTTSEFNDVTSESNDVTLEFNDFTSEFNDVILEYIGYKVLPILPLIVFILINTLVREFPLLVNLQIPVSSGIASTVR